jgi:hypothetical protein
VPGDRDPGQIDDPHTAAGEPTPKRRGRRPPIRTAAASILAAGSLVFAVHQTPSVGEDSGPILVAPSASVRVIAPADPAGLIVRDGDLVEATGPVEDAELCAPSLIGSGDTCPFGIGVSGVEPTGGVTLRGRWHPNGLSDIQQLPYAPTSAGTLRDSYLPDTPPCPAPAAGWRDGEDWSDGQVHDYLHAHADQFAQPFATHVGNARILVVEVVNGDVDQARAALTAIYTDNLCVVAAPGGRTIADENNLRATTGEAVGALMDGGDSGIYTFAVDDSKIRVNMVQLTQPLYDKFAAIGLDHLILDPWIRPAGP